MTAVDKPCSFDDSSCGGLFEVRLTMAGALDKVLTSLTVVCQPITPAPVLLQCRN
jgi:hypothetical protein